MKVELLDRAMVDSDLGVVNAARCSFDKMSKWEDTSGTSQESALILKEQDQKLIAYLAAHQHWTPFAHAQEVFEIEIHKEEALMFLMYANLSGFEWITTSGVSGQDSPYIDMLIRGSLYAWITNMYWLPRKARFYIEQYIQSKYPISYNALRYVMKGQDDKDSFDSSALVISKEDTYPELVGYTLRIHCPIFVKRQLETHRRHFVMTDIEDFSQNEVSRRYIDTEPEIYYPDTWRLQATDTKQGSSAEALSGLAETVVNCNYDQVTHNAVLAYKHMNECNIAHELSRMILPLATYTTFWWTGSLKAWQRMFALRLESHAQAETQHIAQQCYDVITVAQQKQKQCTP